MRGLRTVVLVYVVHAGCADHGESGGSRWGTGSSSSCRTVDGADLLWAHPGRAGPDLLPDEDAPKLPALFVDAAGMEATRQREVLVPGRALPILRGASQAVFRKRAEFFNSAKAYTEFTLPPSTWHKQFRLAQPPVEGPAHRDVSTGPKVGAYVKTSDMCGAAGFSQPELTCSLLGRRAVQAAHALAGDWHVARAFGIELELVGRKRSRERALMKAKHMFDVRVQHARESGAGDLSTAQAAETLQREVFTYFGARDRLTNIDPSDRRSILATPMENLTDSHRAKAERNFATLRDFNDRAAPEYLNQLQGIPGVSLCFDAAAQGSNQEVLDERYPSRCATDADCALDRYCTVSERCELRSRCPRDPDSAGFEAPVSGTCPADLTKWRWETDCTIEVLKRNQVKAILPDADEARIRSELEGVGFELVSPLPPFAPAGNQGLKSVAEVLTLLNHVGVQAGPAMGMHVHVNVGKPGLDATEGVDAGRSLTTLEIGNVWANYARYQYVINEMFQDSRIGNEWAQGVFFRKAAVLTIPDSADSGIAVEPGPSSDIGLFAVKQFKRMHTWAKRYHGRLDEEDFCNWINAGQMPESGSGPCEDRYPDERYMQVNMVTLNKYGTIEFRAFPAVNDAERAVRWVKFAVQFVESFKADGRWLEGSHDDADEAMQVLEQAQHHATLAELAEEMKMSAEDQRYWARKPWMDGNPACQTGCAECEGEKRSAEEKQASRDTLAAAPRASLDRSTGLMVVVDRGGEGFEGFEGFPDEGDESAEDTFFDQARSAWSVARRSDADPRAVRGERPARGQDLSDASYSSSHRPRIHERVVATGIAGTLVVLEPGAHSAKCLTAEGIQLRIEYTQLKPAASLLETEVTTSGRVRRH